MQTANNLNNIDLDALEAIGDKRSTKKTTVRSKITKPDQQDPTQQKINVALEKIKARSQAAGIRQQSAIEARVLQSVLPFWDDENRGVPNPFIRSGLFSVKNTDKRENIKKMRIASLSNYEIAYTGEDLQQDDLSVWMSLINLARNQPMSDSVLFTGYGLIKDLGWRMHSDTYKRIKESIERLKVTSIEISTKNQKDGYAGSLIREYAWTAEDEKGNARWMVRFEPRVSSLFMEDTTTLLEWDTRKKIGTRATVAMWLHSFYSSHREPIPLSVIKLHELCRSVDALSSFRRNIKNALTRLVDVGFLAKFHIENDIVHVHKKLRPKLTIAK